MNRPAGICFVALISAILLFACTSSSIAEEAAETHFQKQVAPILVGRCLECHAQDGKGGLDLRTKASAILGGESGSVLTPGKPEDSLLYEHVAAEEMPPKKPLSESEVATLRKWIADGAYYPAEPLDPFSITTEKRAGYDWWSLQPLKKNLPSEQTEAPLAWQKSTIDRFVYRSLHEKGLSPSAPASPRVLIRRVTYDMNGLPPTPEEVTAFLAACKQETGQSALVGEQAYEQLIDRLLASPRYGEHWARHWLDVVRFGESNGFERNVLINNVWPFRDYVIRSFNDDKPFDQLVLEHLAGDVLGPENPDQFVGTAFLACGPYDDVTNQDPVQKKQIRANTVDEMIRTTGEAFMGMTVGCARCHDHKFDPISQQDYYRLYATLSGVHHGSRSLASKAEQKSVSDKKATLRKARADIKQQRRDLIKAISDRGEAVAAKFEKQWTRPAASRRGTEETFGPAEAKYVRLVVDGIDRSPYINTGYGIDEFEIWSAEEKPRNVALATAGSKAEGRSRVAKDFAEAYSAVYTIDGQFGAQWQARVPTLTIVLAKPTTINRIFFSSDRSGAAGDMALAAIPCEYRIEISLDKENWQIIADSSDRKPMNAVQRQRRLLEQVWTAEEQQQLKDLKHAIYENAREEGRLPQLPSVWAGEFRPINEPTHVFIGGNPQKPGVEVFPASLQTLSSVLEPYLLTKDASESQRRMSFAKWLVAPSNPLTPRVLANRIWHYHFGNGIVATPNDFGRMGDRPSHPELLDWIALQLKDSGWHLKPLHRQVLLSQTYRQSSAYRESHAKLDGQSRLLWRFPPRRLSGEQLRDTILSISGQLNLKMGGPGFRLYHYLQDNVATYVPMDVHPKETYRRAVYHQNARAMRIDLVTDFDSPDCAFSAPRRSSTTSPLQALTMMNHRFTTDMASLLSERLIRDAGADQVKAQVRRAFELAYGRPPTEPEVLASSKVIEKHGLPAFCRALLNTSELIYLD